MGGIEAPGNLTFEDLVLGPLFLVYLIVSTNWSQPSSTKVHTLRPPSEHHV